MRKNSACDGLPRNNKILVYIRLTTFVMPNTSLDAWINRNTSREIFPVLLYSGKFPADRTIDYNLLRTTIREKILPIIREMIGSSEYKNQILLETDLGDDRTKDMYAVVKVRSHIKRVSRNEYLVLLSIGAYIQKKSRIRYSQLAQLMKEIYTKLGENIELYVNDTTIRLTSHYATPSVPYDSIKILDYHSEKTFGATAAIKQKRKLSELLKKQYRETIGLAVAQGLLHIIVFVDKAPHGYSQENWDKHVESKIASLLGIEDHRESIEVRSPSTDVAFAEWVTAQINNVAQEIYQLADKEAAEKGFLFVIVPTVPHKQSQWKLSEYKKVYKCFVQLRLNNAALQVIRSSYIDSTGNDYDQALFEIGYKISEMLNFSLPIKVRPTKYDPESITYIVLTPITTKERTSAKVKGYAIFYREQGKEWIRFIWGAQQAQCHRRHRRNLGKHCKSRCKHIPKRSYRANSNRAVEAKTRTKAARSNKTRAQKT